MVIYWPPGLLSKNNLMSDLSFPLNLDINAVYLTVDDKIELDISSYFHTNDIRILTPFSSTGVLMETAVVEINVDNSGYF